ncbi:hypothetical protein ACYG9R_19255 [Mesorhizobium sp. RSR565B]|uniref:hypothetical protein n=1 Tax=Mesorhizobium sp. L103C565B0 TaxID=1287094 RepID=UPI0004CE72CA|nr:hypothetical protein [Mesorhizobium sp. L103C565B0]
MRPNDHHHHDNRKAVHQMISGYSQWVEEKFCNGHRVYLVTMQFSHLQGGHRAKYDQMLRDAERVYKFLIMRVVRNCKRITDPDLLPFWILVPDFPVAKYAKMSLAAVTVNDGLHLHAIIVMPKICRFSKRLSRHFRLNQMAYVVADKPLCRLHAKRIKTDPGYVVGYALKSIKSGRSSVDDIVIFPRSRGER